MKVVINKCYGGFCLSDQVSKELGLANGFCWSGPRHDPKLVEIVERLGAEAGGDFADLRAVEIPDGVEYEIDEHDGMETIHEEHRSWR